MPGSARKFSDTKGPVILHNETTARLADQHCRRQYLGGIVSKRNLSHYNH